MKYCEFCGKELNDNERCCCPEAEQKRSKLGKLIKIIASIAGVAIVAAIVVIVTLSSAKIDPFDYVTVSYDGYSGNGKAIVNTDIDGMVTEIIGEAPSDGNLEEQYEWMNLQYAHSDSITVSHEPSEGLYNGDEVVVTVEVTGDTAKKIKSSSKTFTVEGLTEVELVDVFANVDIAFEGVSGDGTAKITKKDEGDAFMSDLRFSVTGDINDGSLTNGDVITITVSYYDSIVEKHGKAPKEATKEVTVSGLGEYVTADTLPMDVVQQFGAQFVKDQQAENDDDTSSLFSYSDVELYATYFAVRKEDAYTFHQNELHFVICYKQYMKGEYLRTIYLPLVFDDLVISPDGQLNIEYKDGSGTGTFYTEADAHLEKLEKSYTVTKLD